MNERTLMEITPGDIAQAIMTARLGKIVYPDMDPLPVEIEDVEQDGDAVIVNLSNGQAFRLEIVEEQQRD